MKRIILTVTNDLTHDRRMHRICSSLSATGAEVILVGRKQKHSKSFSPQGFKGRRIKCIFNKGPLFYIEFNKRLFLYLLFKPFDIACACDLDTALAVRFAGVLKNSKSVYDAHEFFTEVPELLGRSFVKNCWERIAKWTIPHFDLRYTVGEELAARMGERYNTEFQVIRNIAPYPESNVETVPIVNRDKILLYQGALNVGRGLEAIIKAMSILKDWKFWIAGEGDITTQLKTLTSQLDLDHRVKFLGWVPPDELGTLLNQAKLGINMLEEGSLSYYYSLSNKFFDCIHAGLPSINMNYPEYRRVNDKYPCSILLDEVTPDKIASTIQSLDNNPSELIRMSAACKEASKEYSWKKESAKLVEMYEKLLNDYPILPPTP